MIDDLDLDDVAVLILTCSFAVLFAVHFFRMIFRSLRSTSVPYIRSEVLSPQEQREVDELERILTL
jgi:hypothetical protein